MVTALGCLLASGTAFHPSVLGASKKAAPAPEFLSQEYLQGSMQGQAGIALDLNADGREDLVIGAPYALHKGASGALLVYLASGGGFPARPSSLLEGKGNLGWSLVALGDTDGDGKGDFAAGAINGSGEDVSLAGTVIIYKGGPEPLVLTVLEGENALDKFGYVLTSGDLNGDGVLDLIVGAPFHSPSPALYQRGAVYVYFGPGYDPATAVKIPATAANGGIGFSLATGDINGDGLDDLLMGASGKVICYYGAQGSFAPSFASPDVVFKSADAGFGRAIAVLWDLNGDGYKDVAVGANQTTLDDMIDSGRLFILRGGAGSRTVNADAASADLLAKIDGEPNCGRFASTVLAVGDVNGDGTPELAVSAVHADGSPWPMTGKIFLFNGETLTSGAPAASAQAIPGNARDMHLGTFLALVAQGERLAAGAPTENANTGAVRLYDLR
jgi:hypothetical protein